MVNLIGAPGTSKRQRWTTGSSATTTTNSRSPTPSASPRWPSAASRARWPSTATSPPPGSGSCRR